MVFKEWISLSEAERETERRNWHVFEPGYWHAIAAEAASQFAAASGKAPPVQRICKSLDRADELIIAVQTVGSSAAGSGALPETYAGFRVVVFPDKTPEGVLVDVTPPSGRNS